MACWFDFKHLVEAAVSLLEIPLTGQFFVCVLVYNNFFCAWWYIFTTVMEKCTFNIVVSCLERIWRYILSEIKQQSQISPDICGSNTSRYCNGSVYYCDMLGMLPFDWNVHNAGLSSYCPLLIYVSSQGYRWNLLFRL